MYRKESRYLPRYAAKTTGQLKASATEFFSLTGDGGSYRPVGKLDCLYSKKNVLSWFLTSFRGGPILSLPFLLLTISKLQLKKKLAETVQKKS